MTFDTTTSRISFHNKALDGPPYPNICKKCLRVDPYVSKEEFIKYIKKTIAKEKGCDWTAVKLKVTPWIPFWGEPWQ